MKPTQKSELNAGDATLARTGATLYALSNKELAVPANHGYDVTDKVADVFTDWLVEVIDDDAVTEGRVIDLLLEREPEFASAQSAERSMPLPGAFTILNAVNRIVLYAKRGGAIPAGYTVDVSRVQRFKRRADGCDGAHDPKRAGCELCDPMTVVLVRVNAPLSQVRERVIVVSCE